MTISDQINSDFMEAYKTKDEAKSSALRMLKYAIKNAEIEKRSALDELETVKLLRKELKSREEAVADYSKGGRADMAGKEKNEAKLIQQYLPAEISDDDIKKIIETTASKQNITEISDFGKLMSALMPKVAGKADGSRVSALAREYLNNA
jgi:uncharacterized protein YqeY